MTETFLWLKGSNIQIMSFSLIIHFIVLSTIMFSERKPMDPERSLKDQFFTLKDVTKSNGIIIVFYRKSVNAGCVGLCDYRLKC